MEPDRYADRDEDPNEPADWDDYYDENPEVATIRAESRYEDYLDRP